VTAEFESLYLSTRRQLLAFLLRRVDQPADAADLLSEVYLVAWRRRGEPPDQPVLWLYGVARKVLTARRRRDAVTTKLAARLRAELVEQYAPDEGDLYVRQVLAQLTTRDRELMELAVYEQLTPDEIATVVQRRPGTVRVQMHRARATLRAILDAEIADGAIEPAAASRGC
jgi:RNA polymerase sigma-70 factor (ECF subfamily)